MCSLRTYWQQLSLLQEIVIILVVKLFAISLIWWFFFAHQKVEVTPESALSAPAMHADFHKESE